QAEDGIRDFHVTGVQTCALPILRRLFGMEIPATVPPDAVLAVHPTQLYETALMLGAFALLWRLRKASGGVGWIFGLYLALAGVEIGRAACRERREMSVEAGA